MTLTLELSDELVAHFQAQNVDEAQLKEWALKAILERSPAPQGKRKSAYGKYAHIPFSSEDHAAQKQAEKEREERRWKK